MNENRNQNIMIKKIMDPTSGPKLREFLFNFSIIYKIRN